MPKPKARITRYSETSLGSLIEEEIVYDIYGNITYDAATGTHIEWNIINLPRKITTSDGIVSEYTYLADGTKVKVSSSAQGALHYLGAMVFEAATPDGTPSFESLAFSDGRIVSKEDGTLEARYHITDHLGSVRTVVRKGNTVVAERDYYPYGQRISTGSGQTMTTALRHTFSGKEDQEHTPARAPYLDFGARLYSPKAGRWLSQDPLAEKYFSISSYAYCAGNPVNVQDESGMYLFVGNYSFNDGALYDYCGNLIDISSLDDFSRKAFAALIELLSTVSGRSMVEDLIYSGFSYRILPSEISSFAAYDQQGACANNNAFYPDDRVTGSGGDIFWDASGEFLFTQNGPRINSTTDLAHEMSHAMDANHGLLDNRKYHEVKKEEWQAVYNENLIRMELGLPLRTHYLKQLNESGYAPFGPKMIRKKTPIRPYWY